jgi:putative flippase GtrA
MLLIRDVRESRVSRKLLNYWLARRDFELPITVPLSYFFHRRVTFRISSAWQGEASEFLRFVISQLVQFGVGLCILVVLVEWAGFTPMWGMVLMTALMFADGFAVNSTWVLEALKGHRRRPL